MIDNIDIKIQTNEILVSVDESPNYNFVINSIPTSGIGGGGGSIEKYRTSENLLAFKLVKIDNTGNLVYCSADNINDINKIIGLTLKSSTPGSNVDVQLIGRLENENWNFQIGQDLYLGLNGDITLSPFIGVFLQRIGYAISPTEIFIKIDRGIVR